MSGEDKFHVQWYPGHMTKTKRMLQESIALVDVVVELLDARIPGSSKNPDIDTLAKDKKRLVVLNKADLANEQATKRWAEYFEQKGFAVLPVNALSGAGLSPIASMARGLMQDKIERLKARGRIFVPTRAMIVGIPNVGKSTLINRCVGGAPTKTGDKPGVTRGKQWVKIKKDFELLDTPGILWPKFEDPMVGLHLAFTGAINDQIMDMVTLALKLIETLEACNPECFNRRYGVESTGLSPTETLEAICQARGFKQKGGEGDTRRGAIMLLDEFRGGKLGRMTLELPEDETTC